MVGDIAASAAGHQDLDTGLVVFLEHHHSFAASGSGSCGPKTGRAPTHNHRIPIHTQTLRKKRCDEFER
jgi:hypothetical protein